MADLESRLRATLTDRAAYLDDPAPYAVPPALVVGVAARAGQLRRRRTWTQVGGAAAAVAVVGLLAGAVVRGQDTAGPALPASSGSVSTGPVSISGGSGPALVHSGVVALGEMGSGVAGSAAERSAAEASARGAAQAAAEAARANAVASAAASAAAALNPTTRAEMATIRAYLQADGPWRARFFLPSGSTFACGASLLGAKSADEVGRYLYVYVFCGNFLGETTASAGSGPMRLLAEGTGEQLRVIGFADPTSGQTWAEDVRRLFPATLHEPIFHAEEVARAAYADALAEAFRLQGRL